MATLAGHMTKLEAVNDILASIGEDPVNSLSSGLPDAEQAETFLGRESRRIQLRGWHVNTLNDFVIELNAENQFALPDNTLKVDTVNPSGGRKISSPPSSAFINASMRRSADNTKWILWDADNNLETWTHDTWINVDLVQLIEFANLTPALQIYVWTSAAHRFQKSVMGSAALQQFTLEDVQASEVDAVNEDMENEDLNIIRDNAHVHAIAFRNNPLYGK